MLNKKKFIDFLDSYDDNKDHDFLDYSVLSTSIYNNYNQYNLNDKKFVGANNVEPVYNSAFTPYSLWQKNHDVSIDMNKILEKEKKSVNIDVSISNLGDIIKIIDDNEYSVDTEYNIDLKSLHNIKVELKQLNHLIGMENIKQCILDQLLYFIQDLHISKDSGDFKHTVIYGPPGTGKTEIAKIIGKMYSKLGILKNNVFKKVTRNDLIAGYLGQTAIKTKKVIDDCVGGVLFIDEAYSLANGDRDDSYSKECLDTLCEALSDYKNDLMVIIAGYEDELNETFFRVNQGLKSRFIWRFTMDEYNSNQMMHIFKQKVIKENWLFENESVINEKWFEDKKDNFKHYGRDMELLFTYIKIVHGRRIYGKDKGLRKNISLTDMNNGYDVFVKNKKLKKETNFMHSIYI